MYWRTFLQTQAQAYKRMAREGVNQPRTRHTLEHTRTHPRTRPDAHHAPTHTSGHVPSSENARENTTVSYVNNNSLHK